MHRTERRSDLANCEQPLIALGGELGIRCGPTSSYQSAGKTIFHVVEVRLPFEGRTGKVGSGDDVGGVAWAPAGEPDLEISSGDPLDCPDYVEHRKASAVTAIKRPRSAAAAQICERVGMCAHEIADVNVISDAGAVRRWIVGAEDIHFRAPPEGGFKPRP